MHVFTSVPHGLVARIPGSHPGGPGSIPGVGNTFSIFLRLKEGSNLKLLCSWDKSLNIWSRMLRIFLKVPSFTFDSLNHMQQIRSYSFYILVIGKKSFIFLMMCWIIWLCVSYNQRAKGIKEKGLSWKVSRSTKQIFQKLIPALHDLMRASWCTSCLKPLAAFHSNGQMWRSELWGKFATCGFQYLSSYLTVTEETIVSDCWFTLKNIWTTNNAFLHLHWIDLLQGSTHDIQTLHQVLSVTFFKLFL